MIVDERMVTYIRSLERPENPVIEAIEQEALDSFVPIIRKETQSFLKVMMLMNRPARVLEVGTAVGFSAILMSEYLPEGSHITTIENYEKEFRSQEIISNGQERRTDHPDRRGCPESDEDTGRPV